MATVVLCYMLIEYCSCTIAIATEFWNDDIIIATNWTGLSDGLIFLRNIATLIIILSAFILTKYKPSFLLLLSLAVSQQCC